MPTSVEYNARTALILGIVALVIGAFGAALGAYSVFRPKT